MTLKFFTQSYPVLSRYISGLVQCSHMKIFVILQERRNSKKVVGGRCTNKFLCEPVKIDVQIPFLFSLILQEVFIFLCNFFDENMQNSMPFQIFQNSKFCQNGAYDYIYCTNPAVYGYFIILYKILCGFLDL